MSTITELKRELGQCKVEKESMVKNIRMLNFGTKSLDHILAKGKSAGNHHSLGIIESREQFSPPQNKGKRIVEFVKAQNTKL